MKFLSTLALLLSFSLGQLQAQTSIKVMNYNLLLFGDCLGVTTSQKYQWLGTILDEYRPDIFTVNELIPQTAYANGIKALSFDYNPNISFYPITNQANSNIVNALFYDKTKFQPVATQSVVIPYSLRDINAYRMIYLPSIADGGRDTLFLTCIVAHLKAGDGSSEASQRQAGAAAIVNFLKTVPDEEYVLVMGDFNVYSHQEAAYQTLVNGSDVAERLVDVSGKGNGWNGAANAIIHTQSTRLSNSGCGSSGGMDDRFDFILASQSLIAAGEPIRIDSSSYKAYGNAGLNYNNELSCSGNSTVPLSVCLALKQMSDHLPVVVELKVNSSVAIGRELHTQLRITAEQGLVNVTLPYPSQWTMTVGGINGQLITRQNLDRGMNHVELDLRSEAPGWYWIRMTDQQGKLAWAKVWKE